MMVLPTKPQPGVGGTRPRPPIAVDPILPGGPFFPPGVIPQPYPQPYPQPNPQWQDQVSFQRKDRNGDGQLNLGEFVSHGQQPNGWNAPAVITQKQYERFQKFDANGDGQISKQEWMFGRHWERMTEAFGKLVRPAIEPFVRPTAR